MQTKVQAKPRYAAPAITVLDQDEVLRVFQMTAAEISAAGCWWGSASTWNAENPG